MYLSAIFLISIPLFTFQPQDIYIEPIPIESSFSVFVSLLISLSIKIIWYLAIYDQFNSTVLGILLGKSKRMKSVILNKKWCQI